MKSICMIRDVLKALSSFETAFEEVYGLSLNEAMVLCALQEYGREMTSTAIAKKTEMSPSHTSKVIRTLEEKKLINRSLSKEDKRLMFFNLTPPGLERLEELNLDKVKIPKLLEPVFLRG